MKCSVPRLSISRARVLPSRGDMARPEILLRAADQRLTYIEASSLRSSSYTTVWFSRSFCLRTGRMPRRMACCKIRGVNPLWVAEFQDSGFKMLGLDRG